VGILDYGRSDWRGTRRALMRTKRKSNRGREGKRGFSTDCPSLPNEEVRVGSKKRIKKRGSRTVSSEKRNEKSASKPNPSNS